MRDRAARRIWPIVAAAAVCVVGVGCRTAQRARTPNPGTHAEAHAEPLAAAAPARPGPVRTVRLGRSVRGRPIEATAFEGSSGCVLILGGIHGNEPVSTALVEQLSGHLRQHPEDRAGRTIVLIPRANPDGLAAGTRENANGVDLNRNFLTSNFREGGGHGQDPLSEPESQILVYAIARFGPSCIVSVHGPLDCIDPDGAENSRRLARSMAQVSPLSVKDLEALPGSLGTYGGNELGLKMITYELDRKRAAGPGSRAYLRRHLPALLVAIREG